MLRRNSRLDVGDGGDADADVARQSGKRGAEDVGAHGPQVGGPVAFPDRLGEEEDQQGADDSHEYRQNAVFTLEECESALANEFTDVLRAFSSRQLFYPAVEIDRDDDGKRTDEKRDDCPVHRYASCKIMDQCALFL